MPWGAKAYVIIMENADGEVHLNLANLSPSLTSLGPISASSGEVSFPSGIVGDNKNSEKRWLGACTTTNESYKFSIFALKETIVGGINNLNAADFRSIYGGLIIADSELDANMNFPN